MKPAPRISLLAAAVLAAAATPASAQVYGSLANFDAVNDTGEVAHGFEIKIEDSSFSSSKIQSVFGLDRNFGVPPTSVVRYGAPTIIDIPGVGVTVRYAGTFDGTSWNVGTPTGPYANAGDSCWTLGNPAYAGGGLSCDHFGVGTYGTPAKTTYNWLLDPTNSGTLTPRLAAIPAVNFIYQPPPPPVPGEIPAPRPVIAEVEAPNDENEVFGPAYWVKTFAHHVDHNVNIEDLLKGNPDVPEDDEVEVEFELFQAGDDIGNGNGKKQANLLLAPEDAALVLRYEFYKYIGEFKPDGEALCSGKGGGGSSPEDCGGLGDYVGAQIAGFNQVQPPRAVPEPGTGAVLVGGLAALGLIFRRRH